MRISSTLPILAIAFGLVLFDKRVQQAAPRKPDKKLSLAFVTNNPADFWIVARKGVEKAEKELGIKVQYRLPANGTAAEQTQIVNDLLAQGVDGMAISPVDPDGQTDLLNGIASRTLLFTQDADASKSKRVCYVGTDNVAAGRQAGEELKRVLPRGGTVMVFVGVKESQNASQRLQGLREALKNTKIRVLGVRTDDADRSLAKSNVSDALIKYPNLAGCVGLWSYNGPAILSALRDVRKTGKVKIVCFDEEEDTLTGIRQGEISATIAQQPFEFGYLSIINMAKYLNGDKAVIPPNGNLFVPTLAIRRDNVVAFKKQLQEWRRYPSF